MTDAARGGDLLAGLSLLRLQAFVAVADHGGYSAAAAHLNLGQPTISFHVKALEQLLGARLVLYRKRRIYLTPAGEELYRLAAAMLRDAERLATAVRNINQGQAGHVRVGASMALEVLPFFQRVLAPYHLQHPRLHITLQFGHSVQLAEAVNEHQLDLACVVNWRLPAGATYTRLHDARFTLMVSRTHPLAGRTRVTSEDVYEAGLITAPIYSQEWPHYDQLLRASGLDRYRVGLEIDGVQARLLATQAGLGVMGVFVAPFAVRDLQKVLRPIRLPALPPRIEVGLVTPEPATASPAAGELAGWLRQQLAD